MDDEMKFGIRGFNPKFVSTGQLAVSEFGSLLRSFIGKSILESWVMWDIKDDVWLRDGPIVLNIDGQYAYFLADNLDEYSAGEVSLNFEEAPNWYGMGDEFPLEWRMNSHSILNRALGKEILEINFIDHQRTYEIVKDKLHPERIGMKEKADWGIVAVEFILDGFTFTLENGLDQNFISEEEMPDKDIRRINVSEFG